VDINMAIRNTTIRKHKTLTTTSIISFLNKIEFATKNEISAHIKEDMNLPPSIRRSAGVVADYIVKQPHFSQPFDCMGQVKSMWSVTKV